MGNRYGRLLSQCDPGRYWSRSSRNLHHFTWSRLEPEFYWLPRHAISLAYCYVCYFPQNTMCVWTGV